jgi:hypothetical protein
MPRLTRESNIMVGNKEFKVEDLLKTIIYLPAPDVKSYFMDLGLSIPRELRMYVLKENLRERVVETRKSRKTMADEINYRLSWFTEFSETQLENLLVFFDDEKIFRNYLEDFWTDVIGYMVEKQVLPKDIRRLYDLSVDHVKKNGLVLPNLKTYNRDLKEIFYDSFGRIDGLAQQKLRPVLYKSSTLGEIRDLGSKYGVNVPRRLKKSELASIIIQELKDENKYTPELEEKIKGMSVIVMQRFAIDHDIKASTELKKEEIIEYILKNAEETKETYFVPESIEVYEKEIHDVSEEVIEEPVIKQEEPEVIEEEIIEEVIEEVVIEEEAEPEQIVEEEVTIEEEIEDVETKVEPEEKVVPQYVQSNINLDEIVIEIRKLREAIEKNQVDKQTQIEKQTQVEIKPAQVVPEEIKPKELSDAQSMNVNQQEALILNSAEFYGDKKQYKKLHKKDEADERERFIEEKKQNSSIGTDKDSDEKLPAEAIIMGKLSKGLGKFLFKLLKVLLKITLIVGSIAVVLLLLYGLLTYYVTTLDFLSGVNDSLNNLLQIGGRGLLDFIHNLFSSLGM